MLITKYEYMYLEIRHGILSDFQIFVLDKNISMAYNKHKKALR